MQITSPQAAGRYSCEVSVDRTFETAVAASDLRLVAHREWNT